MVSNFLSPYTKLVLVTVLLTQPVLPFLPSLFWKTMKGLEIIPWLFAPLRAFVTLFGKTELNENSVVMHFECVDNAF